MVLDFIKGAIGGAGAGSAFGPWGAGIGAVLGGVSSFGGGGGGGSSGGGGGGSMAGALLEPYGPAQDYLRDYFERS